MRYQIPRKTERTLLVFTGVKVKLIGVIIPVAILVSHVASAQKSPPTPTAPEPSFTLRGVIVDGEGAPIAAAEIFTATSQHAYSSTSGEFVLSDLTDRSTDVFVRRIGYAPVSFGLDVRPGITGISIRARLTRVAAALDTVVVEGRRVDAGLWQNGFYRRMKGAGVGTFITPEQLANNEAKLSTLISEVPLIRMKNSGRLAVPQAPARAGSEYCTLSAIIDGLPFASSLVDQVGIDNLVNVGEVKAIEVYLKAGRVPNDIAGSAVAQPLWSKSAECGTIVIWTKGH